MGRQKASQTLGVQYIKSDCVKAANHSSPSPVFERLRAHSPSPVLGRLKAHSPSPVLGRGGWGVRGAWPKPESQRSAIELKYRVRDKMSRMFETVIAESS